MEYKLGSLDWDQIIITLGRPGAEWKLKQGVSIYFFHKELSRNGKAWYYFLYAKLLPTTHVSDVIKDRALVLYGTITGKSINVGKVIQD